ncbi:hypothetical protein [Dyella acidiphila]|uniref:Uncharacterized protein n=1 Tax=Dyella acidiphila TaxID=2775866 RepID=A0ABR9GBB1_9GAMM|nr:hypothetical protein [Dyella acidiphila]MBE1161324.1 hypothetical protein [Dyella acidiphila]
MAYRAASAAKRCLCISGLSAGSWRIGRVLWIFALGAVAGWMAGAGAWAQDSVTRAGSSAYQAIEARQGRLSGDGVELEADSAGRDARRPVLRFMDPKEQAVEERRVFLSGVLPADGEDVCATVPPPERQKRGVDERLCPVWQRQALPKR